MLGILRRAKKELLELVEFRKLCNDVFITPKPTRLIQRILQIATDKDSLILDSFAGSGTTGHAVLKQNAADGGNRRFILVEMDDNIARNVTAERIKRVASGYTKGTLTPDPSPASGRVEGSGRRLPVLPPVRRTAVRRRRPDSQRRELRPTCGIRLVR
jgi:hypothetical protein